MRKFIYLQMKVSLSPDDPFLLILNCKQKKKSLKTALSQPRTNKRNDSISGLVARVLCNLLRCQTFVIVPLKLLL